MYARFVADSKIGVAVASGADSASTTYRLQHGGLASAYLKTGSRGELTAERDRLLWLRERVAVPGVLGYPAQAGEDWLLTSPLGGSDLSRPDHTFHPHRLVRLLACALTHLHSLDPTSCPFVERDSGSVVVHGAACLPNFVFDGTHLAGYLDVGELRVDAPEVDLAAAVWSLDHNLRPGFGAEFLRQYGWSDDEDSVENLRRSCETS